MWPCQLFLLLQPASPNLIRAGRERKGHAKLPPICHQKNSGYRAEGNFNFCECHIDLAKTIFIGRPPEGQQLSLKLEKSDAVETLWKSYAVD